MGDAREELARRQGEVVRALTRGGDVPEGFDGRWVAIAGASLSGKRKGGIVKAAPWVEEVLGARFGVLVGRYMRRRGMPAGGHREDARSFLEWVMRRGEEQERVEVARRIGGRGLRVVELGEGRRVLVVKIGRGRAWVIGRWRRAAAGTGGPPESR